MDQFIETLNQLKSYNINDLNTIDSGVTDCLLRLCDLMVKLKCPIIHDYYGYTFQNNMKELNKDLEKHSKDVQDLIHTLNISHSKWSSKYFEQHNATY